MGARTIVRAAAVAAAAVAVVSCGSDGSGGSSGDGTTTTVQQVSVGGRACAMTSVEEVGNAIGALPAAGVEDDHDGVLTCSFKDAAQAEMASVVITTTDSEPSPFALFARVGAEEGSEPIEGFGDNALWADDALHVLVDGEVVTFTIHTQKTLDNSEAVRSATLELATLAMPRYAPADLSAARSTSPATPTNPTDSPTPTNTVDH